MVLHFACNIQVSNQQKNCMKEELLLLVLSFIVLAMVSLLGHKQVNDKPKTKVVVKWYNYNF